MSKNKFYTVQKTINGKKYVAQYSGVRTMLRANDTSYISDSSSNISLEKLTEYLFEHVIVEPKGLTLEDFESEEELNEVSQFASGVMKGTIKSEEK